MAINQLNKYVWLVETIHRARKRGGITLREIQSRWKDSDLSEGTIAESFYPILTNIFLIDKFLSFVGISEQCQDSAIQVFRQIWKPDLGIIAPVGKEGHDNTCPLGVTQFIWNQTKIRFCFLIKLFSERRSFCLFYDYLEGLEQVYRLHIFFIWYLLNHHHTTLIHSFLDAKLRCTYESWFHRLRNFSSA